MTEETQVLVARLRRPMRGKPGEADQWLRDDPTLIGEVAAALASLSRDLETARQALADLTAEPICLLRDYEAMRQERETALTAARYANDVSAKALAEADAAVRAARAETWAKAHAAVKRGESAAYFREQSSAAREGQ